MVKLMVWFCYHGIFSLLSLRQALEVGQPRFEFDIQAQSELDPLASFWVGSAAWDFVACPVFLSTCSLALPLFILICHWFISCQFVWNETRLYCVLFSNDVVYKVTKHIEQNGYLGIYCTAHKISSLLQIKILMPCPTKIPKRGSYMSGCDMAWCG